MKRISRDVWAKMIEHLVPKRGDHVDSDSWGETRLGRLKTTNEVTSVVKIPQFLPDPVIRKVQRQPRIRERLQ
jgi:hypothetical protein